MIAHSPNKKWNLSQRRTARCIHLLVAAVPSDFRAEPDCAPEAKMRRCTQRMAMLKCPPEARSLDSLRGTPAKTMLRNTAQQRMDTKGSNLIIAAINEVNWQCRPRRL
jgi:hypothetical protein